MSVFNAASYLGAALDSILAQSFRDFEFIVVDDGSRDESARIVADYAGRDARIRPLYLQHRGIGHAINAGVELARGEFIARMDADDVALPHRFMLQLAWVERTEVDICGGDMEQFGARSGRMRMLESQDAIRTDLLFRLGFLQPTLLMRAAVLKENRYDEQCAAEDYELWTRLALRYRLGNMPAVLAKYRRHPLQTHTLQRTEALTVLRQCRRRYLRDLFPASTAADARVLGRVAEVQPMADLDDLALAGEWLVRLAPTADQPAIRLMAARWHNTCLHATHLGPACYHLYRQVAPAFAVEISPSLTTLRLACLLRLPAASSFVRRLRRLT